MVFLVLPLMLTVLQVEAGEHWFYDIYTDTQKQADCTKKETGICGTDCRKMIGLL
ncbi:hypothetical protein BFO_2226 [Tannerella forsythia 92A2]|uniref:Uncharacterized protein n=1 Tax=Tannerella forsythia (strain ATCC 43037 / JCM 10827 / CCUG 21028 A / KCTC 5666 / FDC 338) TaxID=203275 RepID=G8UJA0_TANFA|nr:hypothetical protein BFO_2226 [Tannerella forsythia 92A2]SCQ24194.1 hypothetical protein TFUB22_01884 [Tannerella forsythia]